MRNGVELSLTITWNSMTAATHSNAPVPLCQIYCRMRTNVKSKKFEPILLCLKSQIHKVIFKSTKTVRTLHSFNLVFHMNEQEWTELSKKIVRICRNQHEYLLCGTFHLHSYCLLVHSHDAQSHLHVRMT